MARALAVSRVVLVMLASWAIEFDKSSARTMACPPLVPGASHDRSSAISGGAMGTPSRHGSSGCLSRRRRIRRPSNPLRPRRRNDRLACLESHRRQRYGNSGWQREHQRCAKAGETAGMPMPRFRPVARPIRVVVRHGGGVMMRQHRCRRYLARRIATRRRKGPDLADGHEDNAQDQKSRQHLSHPVSTAPWHAQSPTSST